MVKEHLAWLKVKKHLMLSLKGPKGSKSTEVLRSEVSGFYKSYNQGYNIQPRGKCVFMQEFVYHNFAAFS